jgi:hypothetical protein
MRASLGAALMLFLTSAFGQEAVEGVEGRNYARKTIVIKNDVRVLVTAVSDSTIQRPANIASMSLAVNGKSVGFSTSSSGRITITHVLEKDGTYELVARCGGNLARIDTCLLQAERLNDKNSMVFE